MNHLSVSVIIPTYKDWSRLKLCLDALAKQIYPAGQFEVIVVNNYPEELCPYELPASNIKIITEVKPGSYAARNAGVKIARGEILAFTDSDCIPANDWLIEGVLSFSDHRGPAFVSAGSVSLSFKEYGKPTSAELYEKFFAFSYQKKSLPDRQSLVTANVFIPQKVFKQIGLFDEELLSGGDTRFAAKARANNIAVVLNRPCIVYHPARYSVKALIIKRKRLIRGKYSYLTKIRHHSIGISLLIICYIQTIKLIHDLKYILFTHGIGGISLRVKVAFVIFRLYVCAIYVSFSLLVEGMIKRKLK